MCTTKRKGGIFLRLLRSLFKGSKDVHIEIFPSESGDERISLIPIKTVTIEHDDRNRKYKVGGNYIFLLFLHLETIRVDIKMA